VRPDVRLRAAIPGDAPAIAEVFTRSFRSNLPYLPVLHTPEEDRAFISGSVMAKDTVWVAEARGIVGFIAWRQGWIDHLYVDVNWTGRGIGAALLAKAFEDQRELQLWAFQRNRAAIRFYRRHGFGIVEETDGSANEEKEPDVLLFWSATPLRPSG
jgi:ribosomal protein S18 acetylase RimI-like enzyme